jgi:hypothetical protein
VYVKNVIIFIIRVLKLLVMQGKYILLALVVFFIITSPGGASTSKISAGAPVFIGESNVDLSKALDNCRIIAWWPEGADTSKPAAKNITLRAINEISENVVHYTISPLEYTNYTGTWYCEEKKPPRAVFDVREPQIKISAWDMDTGMDVSGSTLPSTSNITYRIDTNLDSALQLKYRPDLTPADAFYSVKMTNPHGQGITNIYTGSAGRADTVVLTVENNPYISATPYYWNQGTAWNRSARNLQGEQIYPPGKYLFTVSQNLNGMQGIYKSAGISDTEGKLIHTANVTFTLAPMITTTPTQVIVSTITPPVTPEATTPAAMPETLTVTPVPVKTTYSPIPAWIGLAGLGIAAVFTVLRRK